MVFTCTKCNQPKTKQQMVTDNSLPSGVRGYCKECRNKHSNPITMKRRETKQHKALLYKGGMCESCGEVYNNNNSIIFDFHHITNTKADNLSNMWHHKWDTIKEELDKCILLCANCHRMEHKGENNVHI